MRIKPGTAATIFAVSLLLSPRAQAQPSSPANLTAVDHPWDNGTRVDLTWSLSTDDRALQGYVVRKRVEGGGVFVRVEMVPPGTSAFTVNDLNPGTPYLFEVTAMARDNVESAPLITSTSVTPSVQAFDGTRVWFLVTLLVLCGAVLMFIALARKGVPLKVRRIAGLAAVDEAVGRATEMGRPCLFVAGVQDLNEIQTIAGLSVLSQVAKTVARYDATIEVPTSFPLVMTAARETLQAAFLEAGRPEAYNPDAVAFITSDQWGFVAHLQGVISRERPAACFYMGSFFAESLILAEAGQLVGAMQIAGTARPEQLPFFVAACDYTLIGEEFLAASAYLSREPVQLGSLKGQDVCKMIVAGAIVAGVILATVASITGSPRMQSAVDYFTQTVLN